MVQMTHFHSPTFLRQVASIFCLILMIPFLGYATVVSVSAMQRCMLRRMLRRCGFFLLLLSTSVLADGL